MTITMNDNHLVSIAQLREFQKLSESAPFSKQDTKEAYAWVGKTLSKFRYATCSKKDKGTIRAYLRTMTGYSRTQINRLIQRKRKQGSLVRKERTQPVFPRTYTPEDIALVAEVDIAESRRTGEALKKTLSDMYYVYGDARFKRLANISVSHLYNLRKTRTYENRTLTYTKTTPVKVLIGMRAKPDPEGKPGYLRVDSVHQGDQDKQKGVYHINLVDEVTQGEVVCTVEGISEEFLKPVLEEALVTLPFVILNFHSDNGSEYINKVVSKLLQKLLIEQTKSRARHTNDNALVEGKNNAVVRKHFGYAHIPRTFAPLINEFNRTYLNHYLFYHRQCAFAEDRVDAKGKIKKVYKIYQTSCEKLLSIPEVEQYLREGITKESLLKESLRQTHLESAKEMQEAKLKLFEEIRRTMIR